MINDSCEWLVFHQRGLTTTNVTRVLCRTRTEALKAVPGSVDAFPAFWALHYSFAPGTYTLTSLLDPISILWGGCETLAAWRNLPTPKPVATGKVKPKPQLPPESAHTTFDEDNRRIVNLPDGDACMAAIRALCKGT